MSAFSVNPQALASAASTIHATASSVSQATSAAASAQGQAGAFGGEPIGGAFEAMCARAQTATQELDTTMQSLARNVGAAAIGYLVTDQGIVPISALKAFS
jgi:Excreted virulence factor EspC, type VII ESX diderm